MSTKELDLGFRVTQREREVIRTGMKVYAAAPRVPRLTFEDWKAIAQAAAVGSERITKKTGGEKRTPAYTRAMKAFLEATGFRHLNKDDIAAAMRMLPRWDEIAAWRDTLPQARRDKLNNPRQVADAYAGRGVMRGG